jgi:hypothetical protein
MTEAGLAVFVRVTNAKLRMLQSPVDTVVARIATISLSLGVGLSTSVN